MESLREEKARVLCEDQKIGVILPFFSRSCKKEGGRS